MNNPNPFIPQGSLLEQKNRTRSRVKLAVFCVVAINALGLMALLMQGCKREQTEADNTLPPVDTNVTPVVDTNPPPMMDTNPPTPPTPPAPVVTQAPTPTPVAAGTEYIVVKGDTLAKIAKKNGVTLKALEAANPGVTPTKLKIGQKLTVPTGGSSAVATGSATPTATDMAGGDNVYTVKAGDTLSKIAKAHGTTIKAIESENNLTTTKIKVGQKLKIPASAAPAVAAPTPAPAPVVPAPATTPAPTSAPAGQ